MYSEVVIFCVCWWLLYRLLLLVCVGYSFLCIVDAWYHAEQLHIGTIVQKSRKVLYWITKKGTTLHSYWKVLYCPQGKVTTPGKGYSIKYIKELYSIFL